VQVAYKNATGVAFHSV